jgi:hypothetical protein
MKNTDNFLIFCLKNMYSSLYNLFVLNFDDIKEILKILFSILETKIQFEIYFYLFCFLVNYF